MVMRWKLILGIIGGIIVVLLVVFYIILSSYNFNYLKPQITKVVKVKRFEVQVALFPLLSKQLQLKRLILIEPDILVETNAAGKSNLDFEKEKKEAPAKPKEEAPTPSKG